MRNVTDYRNEEEDERREHPERFEIMVRGWRYHWRRYLGWFPIQFCLACNRPYYGGLPRQGWQPWYQEYCRRECYEAAEF